MSKRLEQGRVTRLARNRLNAQRRRAAQAGFTLLELLVVVAIMAAVAGTATVVLQDTDRRASAAAHVAMMDELKKGVASFAVLRGGIQPDNYDSLLEGTGGATPAATGLFSRLTNTLNMNESGNTTETQGFLAMGTIPAGVTALLNTSGITKLRLIDTTATPAGTGTVTTCANVQQLVNDKSGNTVISNIYNSVSGYGCGVNYTIADGGNAAFWVGGQRRVLGAAEPELGANGDQEAATAPASAADVTAALGAPSIVGQRLLMAVGFGPSTTLFDGNIGAMTTVPAYRHTAKDEYNRFIGLFAIADGEAGTGGAAPTAWTPITPELVAVVDGAGDTKEEELGEFDGTRSTL